MACKIPCILFDSPGLRDLMPKDSNNGLLVKPTQSELIKAIMELVNNQKGQIEYANNAEKFVRDNYSMNKSVQKFIKLYHGEDSI